MFRNSKRTYLNSLNTEGSSILPFCLMTLIAVECL